MNTLLIIFSIIGLIVSRQLILQKAKETKETNNLAEIASESILFTLSIIVILNLMLIAYKYYLN
jgi:uncharacterized membrane protein